MQAEQAPHPWSSDQALRNARRGSPGELATVIVFALSDATANAVNRAVLIAQEAMVKP